MTYRIKQDDWDYLAANNVFLDGRDDDGYAWAVGSDIYTGSKFTISAMDGYKIQEISYRTPTGGFAYFNVADDGLTAWVNSYNDKPMTAYTFDVVANAPVETHLYTYTQDQIDFLELHNVTAVNVGRDGDGYEFSTPIVVGTHIDGGEIVYTVAGDFEFELIGDDDANIGYRTNTGSFIYARYSFENPKQATLDVTSYFKPVSFINVIPSSNDVDTKGVNDVFLITDETMRAIINANFNFNNGQETIDYGEYILGLLELPFSIAPEFVKFTDVEIGLAGYKTGFNGDLLKSDVLNINMGVIEVTEDKNNFLDYVNTVAVLHLPFSDPVNIDVSYVIGYEISIEYLINLYDGLATVNISSSKLDGIITTLSIDLNVSVPFGSVSSQPTKNDPSNVKLGGFNGITTPYIEILRNDAVLENGFFTIPVIDETLLIEQNGFVKIDEIDLKVKASKDEKEMILNAINQGVIIK